MVGETTLLFGTWQQEAPRQHKGQIQILSMGLILDAFGDAKVHSKGKDM